MKRIYNPFLNKFKKSCFYLMSHVREGLGYTLKYYDPCFNYNADRFCCSKRGQHFRENVLLSECPLTESDDVNKISYYDKNDRRPLWLKETGIVDPDPYTLTPQDRWHVWCSRMPCSVDQKGVPCQKNQPMCINPADCSGRKACH